MIKIFDTMTRSKREFVPIEPGKVRMYVCGPTVYNLIHIGNARPMIFFDTVRRYFEYRGYEVNYVSNFTDVDDKIIRAAAEEGVDASVISERYIEECKKDMAGMNIRPATCHPRATEEIDGMIGMISRLIEGGYAYAAEDGTVYYRVGAFPEYGKLSHKNMEENASGFRTLKVTGEEAKEDPNDFVLWKPKKEGEPYWESPWCDGRPGWHIECSVMSGKYLGEQIDIHGGGEDLVFPHHENEIAQSEAVSGHTFARYWMHNAFLNIDDVKMSKSLGNFKTVRQAGEQYDLQVLRLFMLSAHYRNPLNFSEKMMESAKAGLERILTAADHLRECGERAVEREPDGGERKALEELKRLVEKFESAMDDDFNTADGLSAVYEIVRLSNTTVREGSARAWTEELWKRLTALLEVLGIRPERQKLSLDSRVEALIAERQEARKSKNYARADEIRDELMGMGIMLEDGKEGVKWKKI